MDKVQIVWLRRDLRLSDQPALYAAAQRGRVVPVYVLDDEAAGHHAYGGASRWWLHHSLQSLMRDLAAYGLKLILRRGDAAEELSQIAEQMEAEAIHANRHYEPWWRKAQTKISRRHNLHLYDGNYLFPAGHIVSGSGGPYKIFTPFARATLMQFPPRAPLPKPEMIRPPDVWPDSDRLEDWQLTPRNPDWAAGMRDFWHIGEGAAQERLADWEENLPEYDTARNLPSQDGSSRLSPHLHFGEISPVQIWHSIRDKENDGWKVFEKELIWRDYGQNTICQFPDYTTQSYRDDLRADFWRDPAKCPQAKADYKAWTKGQTGYPIVDAGMRQLWQTGWMHNRVRMICASFLVKHLLIDWRYGEQWFWDCLVDADYASNGVNWQWVSGSGVDANMFVRIMAPLSQSEKFEAGPYIRHYVPELAHLQEPYTHDPEEYGASTPSYPGKIIGHKQARERALSRYSLFRGSV